MPSRPYGFSCSFRGVQKCPGCDAIYTTYTHKGMSVTPHPALYTTLLLPSPNRSSGYSYLRQNSCVAFLCVMFYNMITRQLISRYHLSHFTAFITCTAVASYKLKCLGLAVPVKNYLYFVRYNVAYAEKQAVTRDERGPYCMYEYCTADV